MVTNAIIGGLLIGAAAVWLWVTLGRVAGISGIAAQALTRPRQSLWPILFVVGLGVGGWLGQSVRQPESIPELDLDGTILLALGGLMVGFGTRLGSGCTSGHGVCGIARLSRRSLAATVIFVGIGMLTATLVHGT
ncbi:MAG: YeeE/YedE family protein [Pseudomonadales bacterium]|nr:YeeE/YedE family protein [Pseudomonadales bacterium]NIX09924.1 YeeE/YedE family protein [Pseudomonadales bacterium]